MASFFLCLIHTALAYIYIAQYNKCSKEKFFVKLGVSGELLSIPNYAKLFPKFLTISLELRPCIHFVPS